MRLILAKLLVAALSAVCLRTGRLLKKSVVRTLVPTGCDAVSLPVGILVQMVSEARLDTPFNLASLCNNQLHSSYLSINPGGDG